MYARDIADSYDLLRCELCFDCLESTNLFDCRHCRDCHDSSGLSYCESCIGCHDCFGCVNLRNKRNWIFNEPFPPEEYAAHHERLLRAPQEAAARFNELRQKEPYKALRLINCEGSSGDQLLNCKDCENCYTLKNSRDCVNLKFGDNNRDCFDASFIDNCELQYNATNLEKNYRVLFAALAWYTNESCYVTSCFNSHHLFGCTGMKQQSYCILNKQYKQREYETLTAKLIRHMQDTGEWGRFFPPALSPFAYNESTAFDRYPTGKDDALRSGWSWREEAEREPAKDLPQLAAIAAAEAQPGVYRCPDCSASYRVTIQELKLYSKLKAAPAGRCPECRHRSRMSRLNSVQLREAQCYRCERKLLTSRERSALICCDDCFEQAVR